MILLFFRGGGTSATPTTGTAPILILLTSGKLAMNVGGDIYQELG